jgi:probable phosphoglycerate mutase
MDQDMPHRISAPAKTAPGPRYSFVLKLVFVPKDTSQGLQEDGRITAATISRVEWGLPQQLGNAWGGYESEVKPRREAS